MLNRSHLPLPEKVLFTLAGIAVLLLCTWRLCFALESQMDIRFYDESYYLTRGYFYPMNEWIADYSPLYSFWYKLQGFFFSDAVALYYASYRIWTFLTGLIVFLLLRNSGLHWLPSILWAMLSLASELALPLWPKAGHLAMLGTAVGIAGLIKFRQEPLSQLVWILGLCLLLAFCRPEFMAGVYSSGFFLMIALLLKESQKFRAISLMPLVAGLFCAWLWGLPLGGSGRGMVAFGQHFAHNWRNISGQHPGGMMLDWVNWRPVFSSHFGNAHNIAEAILNNPADALLHLWFNFRYLIYNGLVFFSETLFPVRITGFSPLYFLVLLLGFSEWTGKWSVGENLFAKLRKCNFYFIASLFCLALPSLLAGLLFQPRPHYILPLLPFFVYGLGRYLSILSQPLSTVRIAWLAFILPTAVFFILPGLSSYFIFRGKALPSGNFDEQHFSVVTSASAENVRRVRDLERYSFLPGFRMFDASTGVTEFLGKKLVQCGKTGFEMNYAKLQNFEKFLNGDSVQGIYLHSTIHYDRFFTENKFWNALRNHPERLGWQKTAIGTFGDSLFIRFRYQKKGL